MKKIIFILFLYLSWTEVFAQVSAMQLGSTEVNFGESREKSEAFRLNSRLKWVNTHQALLLSSPDKGGRIQAKIPYGTPVEVLEQNSLKKGSGGDEQIFFRVIIPEWVLNSNQWGGSINTGWVEAAVLSGDSLSAADWASGQKLSYKGSGILNECLQYNFTEAPPGIIWEACLGFWEIKGSLLVQGNNVVQNIYRIINAEEIAPRKIKFSLEFLQIRDTGLLNPMPDTHTSTALLTISPEMDTVSLQMGEEQAFIYYKQPPQR